MRDLNVGDIIRYTGKSWERLTNDRTYEIIKKDWYHYYFGEYADCYHVVFIDDGGENGIVLSDNKHRKDFVLVQSGRKRKLQKIENEGKKFI